MMNKSPHIDISVIIPAKDEERRLPVFLSKLIEYCKTSTLRYEIIVVDDGSSDQTSKAAQQFNDQFQNLRILRFEENHGKGAAVKAGMEKALGKFALFMDADGSTPPTEIENNLSYFNRGYDIIIGSRVLQDEFHTVDARFYRRFIGYIFNFLVQTILFGKIKDTQCGFKMFRKDVARALFSRMNIDGFGFDLELLHLAHKLKYKIKEVSVNWSHVDESKINLAVDSLKMFINIFQIKFWHRGSLAVVNEPQDEKIKEGLNEPERAIEDSFQT